MRWFRKLEDSGPRLISLSPLRSDVIEANGSDRRRENATPISEYPPRPSSAPLAPCSLRRKHAVRRRPAAKNSRWRSSETTYEDRNCETPDLSDFWGLEDSNDGQFTLAEPLHAPEVYYAALKHLQCPEDFDWSRSGHTISYHQGRRFSPIRAYGGGATPRRTSSMDNLVVSTEHEIVSLQPSKELYQVPTADFSKSKTRWKTLSDKYLKTSTAKPTTKSKFANGLLNKLKGTKQSKPGPETTSVSNYRSFSCGTLPGIQEFRQRLLPIDPDEDPGSIAEENLPGETDTDSGIVQEWSDSSISSETSYIGQVLPCQTLSSWRKPQPKMRSSLSPLIRQKSPDSQPTSYRPKTPMETVQETLELQLSSRKSPEPPSEELKEPLTCHKTRIHVSYPAPKYCSNSLDRKQFSKSRKLKLPLTEGSSVQFIRIQRDPSVEGSELGILIARKKFSDVDTAGYVVAHIVPDGLVHRDGRLYVGDEIINVNGRRLRNMSLSEASSVLRLPVSSVDLVISRRNSGGQVSRSNPAGTTVISVNSSPPAAGNHDYENVAVPTEHPHSADDSGIEASEDGSSDANESAEAEHKPSDYCTLPRKLRAQDSQSFFTVVYEKGPGKKSLGFTIVGGKDSPKGAMGFYVKTILAGGQAAQDHRLQPGDELIAVNGSPLEGMHHAEAIAVFKAIKTGPVALQVSRRPKKTNRILKSRSCENLLQEINKGDP